MKPTMLFPSYIKFIWQNTKAQIIFIMILVLAGLIRYISVGTNFIQQWGDWIEMYISIITLLFAVFIWFNEKKQDWENSLPKRLNITYLLNNEIFAEVKNAPLTGEVDIRNWGQSIGQTILNKQTRIDFSGFRITSKKIDPERSVAEYSLTVYLHSAIEGINKGRKFCFDDLGKLIIEN